MHQLVVERLLVAHHGVGLAGSRLAVNEDSAVHSVQGGEHDLANRLFVDVPVGVFLAVYEVEAELLLLLLEGRHSSCVLVRRL